MHVDRAFARLALAWSPKKSVMLVREPQAGADGGEYRAQKVLGCAAHTLWPRPRQQRSSSNCWSIPDWDDDKRMRSEQDVAELLLQGSLALKAAFRESLEIRP